MSNNHVGPTKLLACGKTASFERPYPENGLFWVPFYPPIGFWEEEEKAWLMETASELVTEDKDWPVGTIPLLSHNGLAEFGYLPYQLPTDKSS
jgi:hypothetical protein